MRAGDVRGPAVEREVHALLVDLDGLGHAAVEHDVAARDEGPAAGRVERLRGARQLGGQAPRLDRFDGADTEQLPIAPAEGADRRIHNVCPEEREALAIRRQVGRERRGVRGEHEPLRIRWPLRPDRREDRVRFGLDELQRVVRLARPGEDGADLLARRSGRAAFGSGSRGRSGRRRSASRSGSAAGWAPPATRKLAAPPPSRWPPRSGPGRSGPLDSVTASANRRVRRRPSGRWQRQARPGRSQGEGASRRRL